MMTDADLPYNNLTAEQIAQNDIIVARIWRDQQLKDSDWIGTIPDHGQYSLYIAYRQELRDWPSTDDFPDTRPTIGS